MLDVEPSRITVVSAVSVAGSGRRMLLSSNSGSLCEMEVNVEVEDRQQAGSSSPHVTRSLARQRKRPGQNVTRVMIHVVYTCQ